MLQRVAASAEDISTAEESYWKKLVEHQKEHVRMDSRGYKGTYIKILKDLLRMCSHEKDIEDKGRGRRGAVK